MTDRPTTSTRPEEPLSRQRLRAWLRLLRATRGAGNHLREFLRIQHATTMPRFDVMAALYRSGEPLKMGDLSRMLLVSNGNITMVVSRLEQEGLALRIPDPGDRRIVHVELSRKGREQFEDLAREHEKEVDKLFGALGREELDALALLTKRIKGAAHAADG